MGSKEPLGPLTPHGVNTVKKRKDVFTRWSVWKRQERERNVLADVMRRDEVIVRGSVKRGNEKSDGWLPPWSKNECVRACACVCVLSACGASTKKKNLKGWYQKRTFFQQAGLWHVYQIPCGQVAFINLLPEDPRLCVSLHVCENECHDLCIPLHPQRRVHGGLCVCVCVCATPSAGICLLSSASFWLCLFPVSVLLHVLVLLTAAPLLEWTSLSSGHCAHRKAWWIFNALYVPPWAFNVTPSEADSPGLLRTEKEGWDVWKLCCHGEKNYTEEEKLVLRIFVFQVLDPQMDRAVASSWT